MTEINVDLTTIPELEAVPEGEYLVSISKVDTAPSKRTPGNTNLNIEMTVQSEDEYHGRKIFDTLSLSEKALWRVRDFVQACGVFPGPQGFKTEELLGAQLIVGVTIEPRMQQNQATGQLEVVPGKTRNKVAGYRSK